MNLVEKALTSLLGSLAPTFINRFNTLERQQAELMIDTKKVKASFEGLKNVLTIGLGEMKADVKRLADKIAAGEGVTQAELDGLAASMDELAGKVSETVTDVDKTADDAVGDEAPEAPAAPVEG